MRDVVYGMCGNTVGRAVSDLEYLQRKAGRTQQDVCELLFCDMLHHARFVCVIHSDTDMYVLR